MRRFLIVLTMALALALLGRGGERFRKTEQQVSVEAAATVLPSAPHKPEELVAATPVLEEAGATSDLSDSEFVPMFFPKAKVVARVSDPEDSEGRRKVIETVETSMKEKYVRVERVIGRSAAGNAEVRDEVAMVANQLMLQKPEHIGAKAFTEALNLAGAVEVKEIAEDTFLATFTAVPSDPRALDGYLLKVREIAGADMVVEPNYIRKIF